jgi:lactate dehydrogenase-like 2-hydroxyacid dehydrogenase
MASLSNLKVISGYGVGYDAINVTEAVRRNILVAHTPNVLNQEVATTALLLLLACYRELLRDDAYVRSGDWSAKGNAPLTRSMDKKTVGILGLGRIGQAIADKLAPWDTTVCLSLSHEKRCAPIGTLTTLLKWHAAATRSSASHPAAPPPIKS